MRKLRLCVERALTINGIFIFASVVFATVLVFAAAISPSVSLFATRGVFPGYVMKPLESSPLRGLELPDITPYVNDRSEPKEPSTDEEIIVTYKNILSFKYFDIVRKSLYNIDRTAYVYEDELDFEKLIDYKPNVDLYGDEPKILIFHTHASEEFIDSREGEREDTIIGVGAELARILSDSYGIHVLHHKGVYDMENGEIVRGNSYEKMEPDIMRVLAENPSVEVLIDLHRDSLPPGRRLITEIDGKKTAQIMFFNGICRLNENGAPIPTDGLENKYIEENLALSLRMKLLANEFYPGFTRRNYIKPYRYSLHMKPDSLLIECGSDANSVGEVKNAMKPLAEILVKAFS